MVLRGRFTEQKNNREQNTSLGCLYNMIMQRDTNAQPVVTSRRWETWLLSLLVYFSQPGRLQSPCGQPRRLQQHASNPITSSPKITWSITNKESIPVMADGLTVEGIPGDLTSHGWMQGARSPSSSFQLPAGSTLFSQLCVLGGDIIAPTRNFFFFFKVSRRSASGGVCVRAKSLVVVDAQRRVRGAVRRALHDARGPRWK